MIRSYLSRSSVVFIVAIGFLLGSTLVVTRFSLGQYESQVYVSFRLLGGSLAFLIAYLVFRVRPLPRNPGIWLRAGFYGLLGTALTMTGFTQSLRYQSSGVTGLLTTLSPIVTVLLAHLFLKTEKLTRLRFIGAVIAFGGAGLLLIRGESGLAELAKADWRGYAWALMGVFTNSAGLVYARRFLRDLDSFTVTSIRILVGAVVISLVTSFTVGFDLTHVQVSGVLAVIYAAVAGTFLAFLFYLAAVQRFGATVASQSEFVVPLVATVMGVIFLHEKVTVTMLVGMAVIFIGLAVFSRGGDAKHA